MLHLIYYVIVLYSYRKFYFFLNFIVFKKMIIYVPNIGMFEVFTINILMTLKSYNNKILFFK
jgi:hypothetical protein